MLHGQHADLDAEDERPQAAEGTDASLGRKMRSSRQIAQSSTEKASLNLLGAWKWRALPQPQVQVSHRPCREDFRYEEHAGSAPRRSGASINTTSSEASSSRSGADLFSGHILQGVQCIIFCHVATVDLRCIIQQVHIPRNAFSKFRDLSDTPLQVQVPLVHLTHDFLFYIFSSSSLILYVTLQLKDNIECIHLMCVPGIVAHINRQINRIIITVYIHHVVLNITSGKVNNNSQMKSLLHREG
jgi:hypothetical protein